MIFLKKLPRFKHNFENYSVSAMKQNKERNNNENWIDIANQKVTWNAKKEMKTKAETKYSAKIIFSSKVYINTKELINWQSIICKECLRPLECY